MSTPLSKSKASSSSKCAVSGCSDPRSHRHYCARHHNASLGKADPLRASDLERCVNSVLEAMQKGVEAVHATRNGDAPAASSTAAAATPPPPSSSDKSASAEYIALLQPITERLLENIKNPASSQPLPGSPLDIFTFSSLGSAAASSSSGENGLGSGAKGSSPPRPIQPSPSDSDLGGADRGNAPPSPEATARDHAAAFPVPTGTGPIIDIKIQFSKQKKKVPAGYELLDRSISGKFDADVNKSGNGKSVMLCYRRGVEHSAAGSSTTNETSKSESDSETNGGRKQPTSASAIDEPKPITSLSIIFRDASEEPPYGFTAIEKTTLNADANLNNHSGNVGRQVYLCVNRGEGAPLYDIGVIFHDKKETLPAGFHELKHTPFGNRADLNSAMQSSEASHAQHAHQAIFVCFRPHVTPVLQTYPPLLADGTGSDPSSKGHLLYAKVLALLTALLYSYDQKMVLHALEGFMRIPCESIPPVLLNRFLQCVCDAAPCFQTYFTTQAHTALLKFLAHSFKTFYSVLSHETFAKFLEVCFLTRHEDKQNEISEGMIALLISKIERAKPCACSVKEKASQIGMNALAGGEGHSTKPSHHKSTTSSSLGGAAAPSPANASVTGEQTTAVSSLLCSSCLQKRALERSPLPVFCRELTLQLVSNVHTAKELESEVKAYQRHAATGPEFRNDVAKLTNQLGQIDAAFLAHIEKLNESTAAAAGPAAAPPGGVRPTSRGGITSSLTSLTIAEHDTSPPPPASTTASASAFAFDEVNSQSRNVGEKVNEKDRIFFQKKEERFLQVAALICAKFAGEPVAFGLTKSEQMKRKLHALRLLFYILHHGVWFFRSTPGGVLLVRRFICPALMSVCVTDNALLWRLLLQTWTVLYDQYKSHLLIELGVFFDHILLSLLESTYVTYEMKKDILDMFHHILSKSPSHLVGLYYSFDNSTKNWGIYEKLNTCLAKLAEGEQKSFVPVIVQVAQAAPGAQQISVQQAQKDQTELLEQQDEALQRQALKLLVHNLHMLAQWVGVPGLKRSPDIPSKPLLDESSAESDMDGLNGSAAIPPAANTTAGPVHTNSNLALPPSKNDKRASRIDTWSWRHDKQKSDAKILAEALKLARTEDLKSALKYLRVVDPSFTQPKQIAHFCFSHETLDKSQVGDFLGSCGDKFMPDADYEALRAAYLEHLDFTGLLFDQGLRLFLCDSGFRLPGEAQKIDRLLEAFCVAYCRDNPNVFRNHSSAFVVSFALVMLNTDLHDSRLKSGSSRRQPMSEDQFVSNLRGVDKDDAGVPHDFPRVFLETLYRNIAAAAIEWKEKKIDPSQAALEEKAKENQTEGERKEEQEKAVRKTFEITVRRALAYLKNWAAHDQAYAHTSNTMIAAPMYEIIWYRIISVITTKSDNYKQGDVELLHICLEGLAFGSSIAICLGLNTERQAFSRQLAKISFVERNRDSIKATNLHMRLISGEHLKQEWYRPFNLLCEKNPIRACHLIFDCAHEIKQKVNYERRQAKLRQIESDFNHEIILVDPNRSFVREGPLTKLSNSVPPKRQLYIFFLFSDLLLYASEGMNSKWKCHRVVHLSLCRIEDLRGIAYADAHAFRIISPQKSFVVSAPTKEKKQQWLEAIYHHLKNIMARRAKYIADAVSKKANGTNVAASSAASPSPLSPNSSEDGGEVDLLRRYSTFIGQSDNDLNRDSSIGSGIGSGLGSGNTLTSQGSASSLPGAAGAAAKAQANHCKLCVRPWAIFRRKQRCRYCGDSVCNDCCSQKCMIPGGEKRLATVCDACFGAIKGMYGGTTPLLSVSDS